MSDASGPTATDLVLLDFDGVVNALTPKPMKSAHSRWEQTTLLGMPIVYSPDVVDAINLIGRKPHVDVRWLTSWESATSEFTALGFDSFDYLSPGAGYDGDIRTGDWKPAAGLAAATEFPGTVIWIDDDYYITAAINAAPRRNITRITPARSLGLSRKQLALLDDLTTA